MMCLMALTMAAFVACDKENGTPDDANNNNDSVATATYVDLGLRSGTKWKDVNEVNEADAEYDYFTYDEAMEKFGDKIPTYEQYGELIDSCQWTWTGDGYNVTGPNGNSIVLPAAGFRFCEDDQYNPGVYEVGTYGQYWSSTPSSSPDYIDRCAWALVFSSHRFDLNETWTRCCRLSVRLVQN